MLSSLSRSLLHRRLHLRSLPIVGGISSPSARLFSFSSGSGGGGAGDNNDPWENAFTGAEKPPSSSMASDGDSLDWDKDAPSSWSTGLTKDHFDGSAPVGRQIDPGARSTRDLRAEARAMDDEEDILRALEKDNRASQAFVDGWDDRMMETYQLLKQVREPGARGAYLKDSEKAEMYKLHKEKPEVYTIERLAKDYRIMRQRVHAILWLKEMEEEEEKKRGKPLDDSVEILLDNFPE